MKDLWIFEVTEDTKLGFLARSKENTTCNVELTFYPELERKIWGVYVLT